MVYGVSFVVKEGSEYLDKKLRRKVGVYVCVCVAAETKFVWGVVR